MFEPSDTGQSQGPSARSRTGGAVRHTPTDLRQRRFPIALRGFERSEVQRFLAELADDLEQAVREIQGLERELGRMEELLAEHRSREQTLRDTLVTAQKLSDEIRMTAEREARGVVLEAEKRADLLVEKAHTRVSDVEQEIDLLRQKRRDVEQEVEGSIATLQQTLTDVRARDQKEREDRIRLLRPRGTEPKVPDAERRREGQS